MFYAEDVSLLQPDTSVGKVHNRFLSQKRRVPYQNYITNTKGDGHFSPLQAGGEECLMKRMNEKRLEKFQNYVVLTGQVSNIELKQSKEGKPYATAKALITTGISKGPMPVKVIALNESASGLKEGAATLIGRLGYEEKTREGSSISEIIVFLHRTEPINSEGNPRNLALLTLRMGKDVEPRFSKKGKMWAQTRAALSQGKKKEGGYKPSLWLNLKAFTTKDGDQSAPSELSSFKKGDLVNVTGKVHYEVYQEKPSISLMATKIEPLVPISSAQTTEMQLG
jgi:hypothetical protein